MSSAPAPQRPAVAIDAGRRFVDARPYPRPYNGALRPDNTALVIIDKPGKGSFCATDLEMILRTRGIAVHFFRDRAAEAA